MKIELVDSIEKSANRAANELHTAFPGEIVAVNAEAAEADIRPYAKLRLPNGKLIDFPVLYNVPIVLPQSSVLGACISFPIRKGDGCVVIVSAETLDYWRRNRNTGTTTRHSLTDAICIPGLSRSGSAMLREACEDGVIIISNGDAEVRMTDRSISLKGKTVTVQASQNMTLEAGGNMVIKGSRVDINP